MEELLKKADSELKKWLDDPKTENEELDGYYKLDSIDTAISKYKEIILNIKGEN